MRRNSLRTRRCRPERRASRIGAVLAAVAALALPLSAVLAGAGPLAADFGSQSTSGQSLIHRVAVFGTDDRAALPADRSALRSSIGLLYEGRTHSVCTAFCVGDDIIATAGHCLFRTAGERPPKLQGFSFRLQPLTGSGASSSIAGSERNAEAQHVVAGSSKLRVNPPIDAAYDWALLRMKDPICKGRALPISRQPESELIKLSAAQRVYQVSYHRDFGNWELAYGAPCPIRRSFGGADWSAISKDFVDARQVILHTCDTGGASSGSPMLIDGPGGPEVIGINVGTYLQARVLTQGGEVIHRYKSEMVANTAVSASAFRGAFETLSRADIIATRAGIKELQRLLGAQGHDSGAPDGVYGSRLNAAIRAFEHSEGRGETGLATVALLKRLSALEAERRGRAPGAAPPAGVETGSVGSHNVTGGNGRLPRR